MYFGSGMKQLLWLIPTVCVLCIAASLHVLIAVPIQDLTRDLAAIAGLNPFVGVISNLGLYLWVAAIAFLLIALSRIHSSASSYPRGFLIHLLIITAYIFVDDAFMIHDYLLPVYTPFNEKWVYAFLFVLVGALFGRYWRILLKKESAMLILALCGLAASVGVDLVFEWVPVNKQWMFLIEDGFKLLGINAWVVFCWGCATTRVPDKVSVR